MYVEEVSWCENSIVTDWSLMMRELMVRYYYWQATSYVPLSYREVTNTLVALSVIFAVRLRPIVLGRTDLKMGRNFAWITSL